MSEQDKLLNQALEGEGLSGLQTHHGYKALMKIFLSIHNEAWEKLETAEDSIARAKLWAIKEIIARIDDKINLSKQAREEFNETIKQAQGTE